MYALQISNTFIAVDNTILYISCCIRPCSKLRDLHCVIVYRTFWNRKIRGHLKTRMRITVLDISSRGAITLQCHISDPRSFSLSRLRKRGLTSQGLRDFAHTTMVSIYTHTCHTEMDGVDVHGMKNTSAIT